MNRVLLVEHDAATADLLLRELRQAGFAPEWVQTAARARALVDAALPDVVVLDWMLPGDAGVALVMEWRAWPRTRALPIVMRPPQGIWPAGSTNPQCAGPGAPAGRSAADLLDRLRVALAHGALETPEAALEFGPLRLDPQTHRATGLLDGRAMPLRLRPVEFRLLHFLMAHPERVHSREQLLAHVWGRAPRAQERTVDVHVKRLREALGPARAARCIETVRRVGYRMTLQPLGGS